VRELYAIIKDASKYGDASIREEEGTDFSSEQILHQDCLLRRLIAC